MILQVKNLSGGYGKKIICKNISFNIEKKDVVCIVGPNGSGKTTLIKLILSLLKKTNGNVYVNNQETSQLTSRERAKIIAYVPQQHSLQFSLSVFDVVLMGRTSHIPGFASPSQEDENFVKKCLEELKLQHLASELYDTLSSGQKQMVLIARALCQKPQILIMDEPTANLDYYNQSIVIKTIQSLSKQGYSILITSHDLNQPFLYANKVAMLKKGLLHIFDTTEKALTKENLEAVYELSMDVISAKDRNGLIRKICVPC